MPLSTVEPDAALDKVIERVLRIPDRYRTFREPADRATRFHRIPADVLQRLLDLGLPHGKGPDGPAFDRHDLKSIVLMLGLPSAQTTALKAMSDALTAGEAPVVERTVNIQAQCPDPSHESPCEFRLADCLRTSEDVHSVRMVDQRHYEIGVTLRGGPPAFAELSPAYRKMLDEVAELEFFHIPYDLNDDLGFLAETGLADCRLGAYFVASRARELGLEARSITGLFLSRPFANRHFWAEVRQEGQWVPTDPFFLIALARWGVLDSDVWPAHRVPLGAFLTCTTELDTPMITHVGGAPSSFLTR
jgi:hypothetical protein